MIEFILAGLGLCILPLLSTEHFHSKGMRLLFVLNFIIFGTLGSTLALLVIIGDSYLLSRELVVSLLFAGFSLIILVFSLDPELKLERMRGSKRGNLKIIVFISGLMTAFLITSWVLSPVIQLNLSAYWDIVSSPFFITGILVVLLMFLVVIFTRTLEVGQDKTSIKLKVIVINRRRSAFVPMLLLATVLVLGFLAIFYKHSIFMGQVDTVGAAGNQLGNIYWVIMGDPLFIFVVVLMLVGGLAKIVASGRITELVSNVLILWLPSFVWTLVMIGVIATPTAIINLFAGIEFLAYLMYLLIYGTLMIGVSAAITVFQSFKIT